MIGVRSSGQGMAKDVSTERFEQFFTTKDEGQGTGLGLSQVYGFIKQSGGHVKLYSEPGEGTTVKVYLPRLVAPEAVEALAPDPRSIPRGTYSRTILVVEDEEDVRSYSVEVLRELGYRVLEAADGPA